MPIHYGGLRCAVDAPNPYALSTALLWLVWLIEQEIGRKLLVLIAGEVGLDHIVTFEAQTA